MNYEVVIGLETHVELKTASKIFCGCPNKFASLPNVNTCPVCLAMPGALPVLNKTAVEYTVKAGLATSCKIAEFSQFDRKHYFYPDLPKAYQISQLEYPLCESGRLEFFCDGEKKSIRINRIHLEEDAGKLVHSESGGGTLVDYNRGGVPLIEIVTEPDFRSGQEVAAYLETLRNILRFIKVADCKMEEGGMRCDVNLSLRKKGGEYGTRTEMKNIASIKAIVRAIDYEIKRQTRELSEGRPIVQETRRWDDAKGVNYSMRTKEDAMDYSYFPDPNLLPLEIPREYVESVKKNLPLLPEQRLEKYSKEFGLLEYDAKMLVREVEISDFFDAAVAHYDNPKAICNWIMTELMRKINDTDSFELTLDPKNFAEMIKLYSENVINQHAARTIFERLCEDNTLSPLKLVDELGLKQISDDTELTKVVQKIIDDNPRSAADFRAGNTKVMAFFVGQAMKATKGKANPTTVNEIVARLLNA